MIAVKPQIHERESSTALDAADLELRRTRNIVLIVACIAFLSPAGSFCAEKEKVSENRFRVLSIRGKVVWQADALTRLHGIETVPEARERVLVLEAAQGTLFPLVEDIRGRAFRCDERLRSTPVELLVRQYRGSPAVKIIKVFALEENQKFELDYWCEICSIAMLMIPKLLACCASIIAHAWSVRVSLLRVAQRLSGIKFS